MNVPGRILATIESQDHSGYVVEKVTRLRDRSHADLLFARSAQPSQGLIDLARQRRCDLIVKDAWEPSADPGAAAVAGQELPPALHDWDLLHHAQVPVMMLKPEPWAPGRAVVAAVDVFDSDKQHLNRHIVEEAQALADLLLAPLHLINVVPVSESLAWEYGVADYRAWVDAMLAQRRALLERLAEETRAEVTAVHALPGIPWQVVSELIDQVGAECLVIGRVKASVHWYLDTTSERLLHGVHSDVVSVP